MNRLNNRGIFDSRPKIVEFCPKSAIFAERTGIIRVSGKYRAKVAAAIDFIQFERLGSKINRE
jgi:hypothetical protein